MKPIEINRALKAAGSNQSKIARKRHVHPSLVNKVVRGHAVARHIHVEIAKTIGRDVAEIWPNYYSKHPQKTERSRHSCSFANH